MNAAGPHASDILFVGNVGEEGEGDLRGVKYLMQKGMRIASSSSWRSTAANRAASREAALGASGIASCSRGRAATAAARSVSSTRLRHGCGDRPVCRRPGAILTEDDVQRRRGPRRHVGQFDPRGSQHGRRHAIESCAELKKLDEVFLSIVKSAVADENRARSTREGRIDADSKVIGERPCGETAMDAPILRTVTGVVQAFGLKPTFGISSTDSNIPMSMGLPALTIGRGGPGGRSHSPDEWTDVNAKGVAVGGSA